MSKQSGVELVSAKRTLTAWKDLPPLSKQIILRAKESRKTVFAYSCGTKTKIAKGLIVVSGTGRMEKILARAAEIREKVKGHIRLQEVTSDMLRKA